MNELTDILFGNEPVIAYLGAQIFGFLGFISMFLVNFYSRSDKTSNWSFKKYWSENKKSTLALLFLLPIAMFIGLRFQSDIINGVKASNSLEFVKDKWFWFYIGGFIFRVLVHWGDKLYKKLSAKEVT